MELTKELKDQLLNFAEFCSFTWGRLPNKTDLQSRFNKKNFPDLEISDLEAYLESPECLANLLGLGFTENHLCTLYEGRGTDPSNVGLRPLIRENLTREQLDALSSISDIADPRPLGRKLKELGISTQTFSSWLYDRTFYSAFLDRLRKTVEGSRLLALNSLSIKAANGDNVSIAQLGNLMENIRPSYGTNLITPRPQIQTKKEEPVIVEGVSLPPAPGIKTNEALVSRIEKEQGKAEGAERSRAERVGF